MKFQGVLNMFVKKAMKHTPEIFMGAGVAGFVATIVMTAKAAPTVQEVHAKASWDREDISEFVNDPQSKGEQLRASYLSEARELAPLCLPPIFSGVASVTCFFMANKINIDRKEAILAAYSLSEKTLSTYQDKVIEKFGEDVHRDILNDTSKEIARREAPDDLDPERIVVPDGTVRCYDNVTGRYFFSSKERIVEAEGVVNKRLVNEVRVSLQEFYYELGMEEHFALGDAIGWDISSPYNENTLNIWFTPMLDDEKNPCLCLNYHVMIFDRKA